jgi:hypothetical protein
MCGSVREEERNDKELTYQKEEERPENYKAPHESDILGGRKQYSRILLFPYKATTLRISNKFAAQDATATPLIK